MQKKVNLSIVITDGVGFRNFIFSDFLNQALAQTKKVHIYSCLPLSAYPENIRQKVHIHELEIFREPKLTWFFRKTKEVAHLMAHAHRNFGIQDNLKANKQFTLSIKGLITRIVYLLAGLFHSEKWIQRFERWQYATFRHHPVTKAYKALLKATQPDLLFFTHQRTTFIAPMLEAAKQLNIPTSVFIFSWDNLPSKGRMCGSFDYYVVWSELMKQELIEFYPSLKAEQIAVGGTPQFEPYAMDEYKVSREAFINRFNLDATKPVICFSCGDITTSRNDELYIEILAQAILNNKFIKPVQLLVRTSPAEAPVRFYALQQKYPFIVWNFPQWIYARDNHPEPWTQRVPTEQDVKDLRAILEYCDLNINMCSTMSLDFMHFDKPVINTVFGNGINGLYDDQRFLKYKHYERVAQSGAVVIAKNEQELIAAVNDALQNPHKAHEQRQALLDLQIGLPLHGTSHRIISILLRFTYNHA